MLPRFSTPCDLKILPGDELNQVCKDGIRMEDVLQAHPHYHHGRERWWSSRGMGVEILSCHSLALRSENGMSRGACLRPTASTGCAGRATAFIIPRSVPPPCQLNTQVSFTAPVGHKRTQTVVQ